MYYVTFLGFLILGSVFCENIFVDIEKNTILNEVSDRYLSFSVNSNLFTNENATYVRDCLCMEKFMHPSYMRILVPSNLEISTVKYNNLNVGVDKSKVPEEEYTKFEQLKRLMQWMKKSRFTPFITFENGERGGWNPKTAIAVMAMAEKYSLDDCIWQLGTECRNQSSQQYLSMLKTFKLMMKVYNSEKHGEWKMSSGNVNKCVKADETGEFFTMADEFLDAITFDSQNKFEDMDFVKKNNMETIKDYLMNIQLWKTIEVNQNESEIDKAIDWLNALGDTANSGYSVVLKNLDEHELMLPSLSYYVSLLHKKLAGRHVLEVSQRVESTSFRLFGHCVNHPDGPISGGVTLFGGNSGDEPANINVKIFSIDQGGEILQFILQEGADKEIIVNGKQKSNEEYFEPIVTEMKPFETLHISLPPKSIGFWVISNTDVEACYFNNEELTSKKDDPYHDMYTANRYKRSLEKNTEEEMDINISNKESDKFVNEETGSVSIRNLIPDYETIREVTGEEAHTIFEDNNFEIRQNEHSFPKVPVNTQNILHRIDNDKLDIAVTFSDDFDKYHLGVTDEPKEIIAGRFTSVIEEDIEDTRKKNASLKSLKNESNMDFEAVNKYTDNIDIDRDFVDIPVGASLYDLDSDEIKMIDSQAMGSSEINYLEDLVTLIGQLTSLMELQEEFLRVERSILQPPSPLLYPRRVFSPFGSIAENEAIRLKRIPRLVENDQISNNLDEHVDVLVVFKKVLLPLNETLTNDGIKELFFDNDSNVKLGKVLRFVTGNQTVVSVDLNTVEEIVQAVSDFEDKPIMETETVESIKETENEDIVFETTTENDFKDTLPILPKFELPKLPVVKLPKLPTVILTENIPKIDDLVNRAKNLLNNMNPKTEDSETQESQAEDAVVGSPLNIFPNLHLANSLEKTRLKMQEMRLRAQAKVAEFRARNLLTPGLHRHLLVKRDIQEEEKQAQHSVSPNVVIQKNIRKKFAQKNGNEERVNIINGLYKKYKNNDFPRKGLKTEINNKLRKKRFVISEDGMDENEVNNDDNNLIISHTVNRLKTSADLEGKKTSTSKIFKDTTNSKMNSQIYQNEIFDKPYESKVAKVTIVDEKRKNDYKIPKIVSLKDSSEGCHKTNSEPGTQLEDVKQAMMTQNDDTNVLETVVDRVTSFFQGIFTKVKDIYKKAGGSTLN